MTQTSQKNNPSPEALAKGYEPEHLRMRAFVIAVVCFVVFAAVTHVLLWYLVKADARPRQVDRPTSAVPGVPVTKEFPRLQPTEEHDRSDREDLEAMREREGRVFEAMGWKVDGSSHRVTVPEEVVRSVAGRARPTTRGGTR